MADTGISIEWNSMSEGLSTQVNISINGGTMPDAFMGVGFSNYDLATYGEDGTFIDLTPYINEEVMPNLTAILEAHPEFRAAITQADGNIYGLPSGDQMTTIGIGMDKDYNIGVLPQFAMINKAWLDDLGLDMPTSLDELEVIDRYKADFESAVSEQEGLWIKNGGPTDDEWESYKNTLTNNCGMDKLLEVYQAAYDRYAAAE